MAKIITQAHLGGSVDAVRSNVPERHIGISDGTASGAIQKGLVVPLPSGQTMFVPSSDRLSDPSMAQYLGYNGPVLGGPGSVRGAIDALLSRIQEIEAGPGFAHSLQDAYKAGSVVTTDSVTGPMRVIGGSFVPGLALEHAEGIQSAGSPLLTVTGKAVTGTAGGPPLVNISGYGDGVASLGLVYIDGRSPHDTADRALLAVYNNGGGVCLDVSTDANHTAEVAAKFHGRNEVGGGTGHAHEGVVRIRNASTGAGTALRIDGPQGGTPISMHSGWLMFGQGDNYVAAYDTAGSSKLYLCQGRSPSSGSSVWLEDGSVQIISSKRSGDTHSQGGSISLLQKYFQLYATGSESTGPYVIANIDGDVGPDGGKVIASTSNGRRAAKIGLHGQNGGQDGAMLYLTAQGSSGIEKGMKVYPSGRIEYGAITNDTDSCAAHAFRGDTDIITGSPAGLRVLYPAHAVGSKTGMRFQLWNSAGTPVDYACTYAEIISDTAGAEGGRYSIVVANSAGANQTVASFDYNQMYLYKPLLPISNNTIDLGSSAYRYRSVYCNSLSVLGINNAVGIRASASNAAAYLQFENSAGTRIGYLGKASAANDDNVLYALHDQVFCWDDNAKIRGAGTALRPEYDNSISLGDNSKQWLWVCAKDYYENGVLLSDKYAPSAHTHTSLTHTSGSRTIVTGKYQTPGYSNLADSAWVVDSWGVMYDNSTYLYLGGNRVAGGGICFDANSSFDGDKNRMLFVRSELAPELTNTIALANNSQQWLWVCAKDYYENGVLLSDKYAPRAHTHAISDVTNLQTTLNSKEFKASDTVGRFYADSLTKAPTWHMTGSFEKNSGAVYLNLLIQSVTALEAGNYPVCHIPNGYVPASPNNNYLPIGGGMYTTTISAWTTDWSAYECTRAVEWFVAYSNDIGGVWAKTLYVTIPGNVGSAVAIKLRGFGWTAFGV